MSCFMSGGTNAQRWAVRDERDRAGSVNLNCRRITFGWLVGIERGQESERREVTEGY